MEDLVSSTPFWRGQTVLITGHTGFKGSWLSLWLRLLGAEVIGYSLPASRPSMFRAANIHQDATSIEGDVEDAAGLSELIGRHDPSVVFHLAAQALVRRSYVDPIRTFHTNVLGTANLLDAVRQHPRRRAVVIVTSDKCYENREWIWSYRENDTLGGADPYSASKACAELVAASFRQSFPGSVGDRPLIATVRAGNVIGGGDWGEDRLVPDCIRALIAGREIAIRNPGSIRPWQHVLEPLAGYIALAERLLAEGESFAESWNFGGAPEETQSVAWIVDRVVTAWNDGDAESTIAVPDGLHETSALRLDSTKAKSLLGWRPRWALHTAIEKAVDWYKCEQRGGDVRALSIDQISEYMNG